jgi:hypothetical protein
VSIGGKRRRGRLARTIDNQVAIVDNDDHGSQKPVYLKIAPYSLIELFSSLRDVLS